MVRWSELVSVARARRRVRCWLRLPMRSELDPVAREGLSELVSLVWSSSEGWHVPCWGILSSEFVAACRRSGLWRSRWWFVVPVDLQDAVGRWGIGPGVAEDASAEFLSSLSVMRSDELRDLSAELLSEDMTGERSEVVSEVSYLLGRRRPK